MFIEINVVSINGF